MSNTGLFRLRSLSAEMESGGTIRALHAVEAQCASCSLVCKLSLHHGLVNLAGAGVLVCPHCGSRQGISRARFEEFARRFPTCCAPVFEDPGALQQTTILYEKGSQANTQAVTSGL